MTDKDFTEDLLFERAKTHGSYIEQSLVAQRLRGILYSGSKCKEMNSQQQEALFQICTKLSRIVCGDPDFLDHWEDLIGYARLGLYGCSSQNR